MRKLTLLATTAIAIVALGVAAAPASADRPFELQHQYGTPCNPCVEEYEGTVDLGTAIGEYGRCDVRLDAVIYQDGWLEAHDVEVEGCTGAFAGITEACDEVWPGQIRLPDTGPAKLDLTSCLDVDYEAPQRHDITYDIVSVAGTRTWDQAGPATMHEPWAFQVIDSLYEDANPADNTVLVLL